MIEEIENYAKEHNIPIMLPDGIEYLCNYIKEHNIKSILEIGSAIGYSAIKMASVSDDIKITTIEKDTDRYNIAVDNIRKFNLLDRILIINDDALNVSVSGSYDLIFIDASKSANIKFFNNYGYSHYYIDGTVLHSGKLPVLLVDTKTRTYYSVTKDGKKKIVPYEKK